MNLINASEIKMSKEIFGKYLSKEQMFGSALNERLKHLIQYRAGIIK